MKIETGNYYITRSGLIAYVGYETTSVTEAYYGWIDNGTKRFSQTWDAAGRAFAPRKDEDLDLFENEMVNEMADAKTMNKVIGGEEFKTTEPTFKELFVGIFEMAKNKARNELGFDNDTNE